MIDLKELIWSGRQDLNLRCTHFTPSHTTQVIDMYRVSRCTLVCFGKDSVQNSVQLFPDELKQTGSMLMLQTILVKNDYTAHFWWTKCVMFEKKEELEEVQLLIEALSAVEMDLLTDDQKDRLHKLYARIDKQRSKLIALAT